MNFRTRLFATVALGLLTSAGAAKAQISDDVVKIGVLADLSGVFTDIGGRGSVVAAQMAAADFGGKVRGKAIEIVEADHLNKTDVGAATVRRWFDEEKVDAVTELSISSVALAAQELSRERKKTLIISGAATSDLTGKFCSPYSTHWSDDTYALAAGTSGAVVRNGGKSWYFLTVDYAFGHAMERDAMGAVTANGGTVAGSVRHPINSTDMSSFLLQAQGSGAQIIGLANVGVDTIASIKQAHEFGITGKQKLAGFLVFISDIHSIGLANAQGLLFAEGFYWDLNPGSRAFAKRFGEKMGGKMPTKEQAATYAAVMNYLKAIDTTGTDESLAVNTELRRMPIDYFGESIRIRADGQALFDMTLFEVKKPEQSKGPWDYYNVVATIPKEQAWRPLDAGGCKL